MRQPPGRVTHLSTGITTGYSEHGVPVGRPPVVLLHAWGESRRVFVRLLSYLPGDVHSYAPDLRGHGDASKPESGYELPDLADDVVAFLDSRDVPSAVLVGASSGGYVAQQVAVAYPDRVAGLVLAGSPRSLRGRLAPFAAEISGLRDPLDPAWVRAFTLAFVPPGTLPEWYVQVLVEDGLRIPAEIWQATLDGLATSVPPTDVGTIRAPTLVVMGAQDSLLGRQDGEALASLIPRARLAEYPDTGHLVHWLAPEWLANDVAAFSEELARARAEQELARARAEQAPPLTLARGGSAAETASDARPELVRDAQRDLAGDARPALVGDAQPALVGDAQPALVGDAQPGLARDAQQDLAEHARPRYPGTQPRT
jgi:pimeloyl-ACP methyl ester carboxylesterase